MEPELAIVVAEVRQLGLHEEILCSDYGPILVGSRKYRIDSVVCLRSTVLSTKVRVYETMLL